MRSGTKVERDWRFWNLNSTSAWGGAVDRPDDLQERVLCLRGPKNRQLSLKESSAADGVAGCARMCRPAVFLAPE